MEKGLSHIPTFPHYGGGAHGNGPNLSYGGWVHRPTRKSQETKNLWKGTSIVQKLPGDGLAGTLPETANWRKNILTGGPLRDHHYTCSYSALAKSAGMGDEKWLKGK
jgi:hypothetical protein